MEPEKGVDFFQLIRKLDRKGIRHLIIGRRAVILYGGPVLTADHDFWISPEDRFKTLSLLEELGFELSHAPNSRSPIVSAFSGMKKYDFFFQRKVQNIEGETIEFEECYKNAVVKGDPPGKIRFHIPSIEDLIRLKKVRKPNAKDEQDIEYLLKSKTLFKKTSP
jgi:hypothetical protein